MKREKSCGAVIFREDMTERYYLILTSTQGHTTLCKGHVEGKETEHETAVREILEETGLTVGFVDGFREVITYAPKPGSLRTWCSSWRSCPAARPPASRRRWRTSASCPSRTRWRP